MATASIASEVTAALNHTGGEPSQSSCARVSKRGVKQRSIHAQPKLHERPSVFALMTIVLQLGASALVIVGKRWAWFGAGALALFTLAAIPLAHDFWPMEGQMAFLGKTMVQEHVAILAAILGQLRKD
ncbi:MAG: DoxX family protein [Burkholderiales bacterium]